MRRGKSNVDDKISNRDDMPEINLGHITCNDYGEKCQYGGSRYW